ncbi:MAG: FHA domain-containing protein [Thermoanaerobaculia bacterium]
MVSGPGPAVSVLRLVAICGGEVRHLPVPEPGPATLGSAPDTDLVLDCPGVSRRHARVAAVPGGLELVDLQSRNGLIFRGRRVRRVTLRAGETVQLGRAELSLQEVDPGDLELALAIAPEPERDTPRRRGRVAETAPLPVLDLVRELESLTPASHQRARESVLRRVAEAVGAAGLWSFAPVEGDLFLRDCVGAVPSDEVTARVADGVLGDGAPEDGEPRELATPSGRAWVFPPPDNRGPVLVASYTADARPQPWAEDLLAYLAERLRGAESGLTPEEVEIHLPPLVTRASSRRGKTVRGVSRRALELLLAHPWPGRLGELERVLEDAVGRCPDGGALETAHFRGLQAAVPRDAPREGEGEAGSARFAGLSERLEAAERDALLEALERSGGDRARAADLLGISPASLARKLDRHGLE